MDATSPAIPTLQQDLGRQADEIDDIFIFTLSANLLQASGVYFTSMLILPRSLPTTTGFLQHKHNSIIIDSKDHYLKVRSIWNFFNNAVWN